MREPPAEILRRLRPIPTVGPPTTVPRDVVGVGTDGAARRVDIETAGEPVVLLFLSSGCLGCRDLWQGLVELQGFLAGVARLAVVTHDPGQEDPAAIAHLVGEARDRPEIEVVMSSDAFRHYRVAGPPFVVVAAADAVRTEGVAWGLEETARLALEAAQRRGPRR